MSKLSFIVEDSTFEIPINKIPKGCLLLELHKASDKFRIDTIDGSILLDVDAKEFDLVYEYLIKGTLDKELYLRVQHLFEYLMLDYNEFGYPQEFFEIKKKEDYIRKNFNNLLFKDHDMRSMYYNLVELTEDVYNDIFVNCDVIEDPMVILTHVSKLALSYDNFIKEFTDRLKFFGIDDDISNLIVAGGSIITSAFDMEFNDMDMFLVNGDVDAIENFFSRYKKDVIFHRTKGCVTVNYDNTSKGMMPKCELQIILRRYSSVSEVLTGFDVDCCGICYELSTKKFWITPRAMYAIKHRLNVVDFDRLSLSYEYRLTKYSRRGFGVFVPFFDPSKINISKVMKDLIHLDIKKERRVHLYNYASNGEYKLKENGLDMLIRYSFGKSIYNRLLFPQDYNIYKDANIYISEFVKDFSKIELPIENKDKFINIPGIKIISTKEKEDSIIFTILALSYENKMRNNIIQDIIKCSHGIIVSRVRADDQSIMLNFDQSHTAKYYDKKSILYYSSRDYKDILRLSDEVYDVLKNFTTLTQGIEFITINPGQQLTGSFHRLVLDDYREWYKSDYYTF